jgi:hypothetical protein
VSLAVVLVSLIELCLASAKQAVLDRLFPPSPALLHSRRNKTIIDLLLRRQTALGSTLLVAQTVHPSVALACDAHGSENHGVSGIRIRGELF